MIGSGVNVRTFEINDRGRIHVIGTGADSMSTTSSESSRFDGTTEIYNARTPTEIGVTNFDHGKSLRVVIVPTNKGHKFNIDFRTSSEVALHFNPRFNENTVVFNSTRKGQWLQEERTKMPFRQGHVYTLEFIANNGRIQVLLNGNAFFEFVERLPSSHIRSIEIAGDVHVHSAQIL